MRKASFAFFLILAAFLGGAAVNGPGLEWLKVMIRSRLLGASPSSSNTRANAPQVHSPPRDVPAAPLPALTLDVPDHQTNPSDATSSLAQRSVSPSATINVVAPAPKSQTSPIEPPIPDEVLTSPLPQTTDVAVAPAAGPVPSVVRDWPELRRRMQELGVSRYEIEGEPMGRSRFRCLIPLAGRRAVGQQFEGEGDDDFLAAEAALRRVALWKATESETTR